MHRASFLRCFKVAERLSVLAFTAQVQDLSRLIECMGEDPFAKRYGKLSAALAEVIEVCSTPNLQAKHTPLI
jgi:hypothetical protein